MVGFGTADVPPSAAVKYVAAGSAACIADLSAYRMYNGCHGGCFCSAHRCG